MKVLIVMNSVVGKVEQIGFSGSTLIAAKHGDYFRKQNVQINFLTTLEGVKYLWEHSLFFCGLVTSTSKKKIYWWNYLLNFLCSLKYLRRRYDNVYCVTDLYPDVLFTLLCRAKRKIFSCHHKIRKDDKWHPKISYYLQKLLHFFIQRQAHRIVVPNELIDLKNKLVVYGAADYHFKKSIKDKTTDVIFIGNCQKVKGFDLLFKIVTGLNEYYVEIWGDATNIIKGKEKYEKLANAKVCIVPSYWESFSLVMIEAMSVGIPVVAWNLPTLKSIYKKGVWFVKPYSVRKFVTVVRDLLINREELYLLSKEAYEFSKKFRWENESRKVYSVLQD